MKFALLQIYFRDILRSGNIMGTGKANTNFQAHLYLFVCVENRRSIYPERVGNKGVESVAEPKEYVRGGIVGQSLLELLKNKICCSHLLLADFSQGHLLEIELRGFESIVSNA